MLVSSMENYFVCFFFLLNLGDLSACMEWHRKCLSMLQQTIRNMKRNLHTFFLAWSFTGLMTFIFQNSTKSKASWVEIVFCQLNILSNHPTSNAPWFIAPVKTRWLLGRHQLVKAKWKLDSTVLECFIVRKVFSHTSNINISQ